MQAVALVTGDESLVAYNLTIDASDVYDFIKDLTINWRRNASRYNFVFNDQFGVDFAETIGPNGFCFNFNLIHSHDLFYLEHLPGIFNYTKSIPHYQQIFKYRSMSQQNTNLYPKHVTDPQAGFFSIIHQTRYRKPFDTNHHEKHITQGFDYFIHNPHEVLSKASIWYQSIVNHSMIIYLNPQKTIIDEALESFEPERFGSDLRINDD
jgi:hypothetical protein